MLRIQSLWLLIAGLISLAGFHFCYWHSVLKDTSVRQLNVQTTGNVVIYIAAIALLAIPIGTIFLFRQRGLQNRLCFLGMAIALGMLVLECLEVTAEKASPNFAEGAWRVAIAFPVLIIVALILAVRGIRRDQKLLKDLRSGRLR